MVEGIASHHGRREALPVIARDRDGCQEQGLNYEMEVQERDFPHDLLAWFWMTRSKEGGHETQDQQ